MTAASSGYSVVAMVGNLCVVGWRYGGVEVVGDVGAVGCGGVQGGGSQVQVAAGRAGRGGRRGCHCVGCGGDVAMSSWGWWCVVDDCGRIVGEVCVVRVGGAVQFVVLHCNALLQYAGWREEGVHVLPVQRVDSHVILHQRPGGTGQTAFFCALGSGLESWDSIVPFWCGAVVCSFVQDVCTRLSDIKPNRRPIPVSHIPRPKNQLTWVRRWEKHVQWIPGIKWVQEVSQCNLTWIELPKPRLDEGKCG